MCFLKVEKVHVSSNYKFNVHKYCNTKSFFKQNSELQEKLPENRPAPHKISAPKKCNFFRPWPHRNFRAISAPQGKTIHVNTTYIYQQIT